MRDNMVKRTWERPRRGGLWFVGFLASLVALVTILALAAVLGLDRDPRLGFLTEALVGFGLFAVLGFLVTLFVLIGSRERISPPDLPGNFGVITPKATANVGAQSGGGLIMVESSSEFDLENFLEERHGTRAEVGLRPRDSRELLC